MDGYTTTLSAYLDGELNDLERNRLEAHLATCGECRTVLADLRMIVAAAPHYEGRAPGRDLWPSIKAHLTAAPKRRPSGAWQDVAALVRPAGPRSRFGWPVVLAASLLMALVGGGAVWVATHRMPAVVQPSAPSAAQLTSFADRDYQSAVADLERVLDEGRSRLDTATVRVIDESLRKIDAAIAEARAAIAKDSTNAFLSRQVTANMRRKLTLLRAVAGALART